MARSVWSGVISFGLVSVPVTLHPATREHDVSFHQFEKGTTDRIRYQRDGYLVLYRPGPPRPLAAAPSPGCP